MADEDAIKPPEEVIPYLAWRERVTLLAAREKGGKSTFAAAGVGAISAGSPFLERETGQGTTLWIGLEEHVGDTARNFLDFNADPRRIALVSDLNPEEPIVGTSEMGGLLEICEIVQPAVIVWDSLSAYADITQQKPPSPGDAAAWTRIVREITEFTREVGAASIVLHHARKLDGEYRDSTAIGANVDMLLSMKGGENNPDETKRTIKGKGRWRYDTIKVDLREDTYFLLGKDEVRRQIMEFVSANPGCGLREMRAGVNAKYSEIQAARDELIREGRLVNEGTENRHAYRAHKILVPVEG